MTDYTLYYWPLPFRGQFVRSVLAHVHATWDEAGITAISALMGTKPSDQPVPHMAPPVLTDHAADISLAQMCTEKNWKSYVPRLRRWMEIFEETGRRHGLTAGEGNLLGTEEPGVADLTTHILWGTMTAKLPTLRPMLDATAPSIAGLSNRIARSPAQVELRRRSDSEYGDEWCSGEIEASLRAVL